jgi:hypothetical protein
MGRAIGLSALIFAATIGILPVSYAYTPTLNDNGLNVRWKAAAKINLAGNPTNKNGFGEKEFRDAVVRGLERWHEASGGTVGFDYWQGTNPSVYIPNSAYNGLSSIYFASNSSGANVGTGVLGLTQVWYNTDTGQILETDIVINDINYRYSSDPRDTSGYGVTNSSGSSSAIKKVYLDNVITHELGHAYGLSHSGGLQSTMLFMESPEQAYLGCDDQVAIRALYPGEGANQRGVLTGAIRDASNNPVFGAHVEAISRKRGTVLATAISDRGGRFNIGALEPGSYFLMAEPFVAGASSLSGYYANMNVRVCSGAAFSRSVLKDSNNRPATVQVGAGGVTEAPVLKTECSSGGGASVLPWASTSSTPAVLYTGSQSGGFGFVDKIASGSTTIYKLASVQGRVEVHAMGYSLYSPVETSISIYDSSGRAVAAQIANDVYSGLSGYVNHDAALVADGLSAGDYTIKISTSALNASVYPAGPLSLDSVPFVLITGSVNETADPPLANVLANNARCRMEENFPAYTSPAGDPPRTDINADKDKGIGFCGNIRSETDRGSGGDDGASPSAIAGWFLPWALMLLIARHYKLRLRLVAANL